MRMRRMKVTMIVMNTPHFCFANQVGNESNKVKKELEVTPRIVAIDPSVSGKVICEQFEFNVTMWIIEDRKTWQVVKYLCFVTQRIEEIRMCQTY